MGEHYTTKEWAIVWFLYNSNKLYRNLPHSFPEFERDMGYFKSQCGGVRKFLSYLVKEGVLIKKAVFKFDNIKRYTIDKNRLDEIVQLQKVYQIIISLEYGELKYSNLDIPSPAKI